MESKNGKLIEIESRLVATRGWGVAEWGDFGQRVPASSHEMSKFRGSNVQYGDYSQYCII